MRTRVPFHASLPRRRMINAMVFQREALAFRLRRNGLPSARELPGLPELPPSPPMPPQDRFTVRALALLRTGDRPH